MRKRTSIVLFLVVICILSGCDNLGLKSRVNQWKPLEDKEITASLDAFGQELNGIKKALDGEVSYMTPLEPVLVFSKMKRAEIEAEGFGQPGGSYGGRTEWQYEFKTPLDKCNWLSHFIWYPFTFKLSIAPGIRITLLEHELSLDKLGMKLNLNFTEHASHLSGLKIDELESWKGAPFKAATSSTSFGVNQNPLSIEMAIEVPGGDAWLDDMDTSFHPDEVFTFHIKTARWDEPGNIAYGSVDVNYKDILPFLTELTATFASAQGFNELTPEQKGWLSREPVTNINAWGEYLVAYSKRTWEYYDVMPIRTKGMEYLDRIADKLDKADPGNTVSLMRRSGSYQEQCRNGGRVWELAVEKKPYLPMAYKELAGEINCVGAGKPAKGDARWVWVKAVEARPDYGEFHMHYAGVLLTNGDYDEAVAEYRIAQRIEPGKWLNEWHTWGWWGGKFKGSTDASLETKFAEMIVDEYPDDQGSRQYLANIYTNQGAYDKAREVYDYNRDIVVGMQIAKELESRGKIDEAIGINEDMVDIRPDYVSNWQKLAELYKQKGDEENELRALRGFLENVDSKNSGYADDINKAKGRLAGMTGDTGSQIVNLLGNFPSDYLGDPLYLDLADALYAEGYTADALYLTYQTLASLKHHANRFSGDEQQRYDRAKSLKDKLVHEFWPEFDASKAVETYEYKEHYQELEEMKKADGVRAVLPKYREMLAKYPSKMEANTYRQMVEKVYADDLEMMLDAKLVEIIVAEPVGYTSTLDGLRYWDEYDKYLEEKLMAKYGGGNV